MTECLNRTELNELGWITVGSRLSPSACADLTFSPRCGVTVA